ncbi:hypothetical protein O3P69_009311 [Scylla paramamosain]|uniref:Reverse transcriptase domain-containing protein n=1 Tax=Scylla paramamosain TaxID=85552 RepID=A0AAW0TD62_SCYPA
MASFPNVLRLTPTSVVAFINLKSAFDVANRVVILDQLVDFGVTGNLLGTFVIFPWAVQVFVGVVEVRAALWVWDQLFLDTWRRGTVKLLALSLLAVIRPWVMRASADDIMKVLLEEPGRVYLGDLRRAFAHLAGGGRLRDTPTGSYMGDEGMGGVPSIQVVDTSDSLSRPDRF